MSFDAAEYAKAMDHFLLLIQQVTNPDDPSMHKAVEPLCRLLRIARIYVDFYQKPEDIEQQFKECVVIYDAGNIESDRNLMVQETTEQGSIARYYACQFSGQEDWSTTECDKIHIFLKTLFAFNGRARVMNLAWELTYRDSDLTIYNLNYFMKATSDKKARKEIDGYGVCYFNLKRFSIANQIYGRRRATEIMRLFVTGLQDKLGKEEFVCRIGGDNFIVLFQKEHLEQVQEYLQGTPIYCGPEKQQEMMLSAWAGYYMIPDNRIEATEIMDRVSCAFHVARNTRSDVDIFYDERLMERAEEEKQTESLFRMAYLKEEFQVYYQPKVSLDDFEITGAEALCRWFRDGKILAPDKFIPTLEQSRKICLLDFYMLEHVCQDLRRWIDQGRKAVRISVNFSRRHLGNEHLAEQILEVVDKYQVPHEYIEIELTETTAYTGDNEIKRLLYGLEKQGVSTAVDDFGKGYSSLNLLRNLPWKVLKIDKEFLDENEQESEKSQAMLAHVITMAEEMGLECIVEGVETVEHVKMLREKNCRFAQGYYFDKPMPVKEFEEKLKFFS